jgi:glutathione synthase/RimK-type ligase-like ATP-grasp enzyme
MCELYPDLQVEGVLLRDELEARGFAVDAVSWNGPADWSSYDAVIVRETWDYTFAVDEFVRWARSIGSRLHNAPDGVAWNVDKRYLFDLERAGLPVVAGDHLPPGAVFEPPQGGRFVIKPTVSAGSRDTAVYDGERHDAARAHVGRLHAAGRDVLVQPYYERVDEEAETAVVLIDGKLSHSMRKGPLLELDQPDVDGLYRVEDMCRREADSDVLALAERAWEVVAERFGPPLYARVDVLRSEAGDPAVLELELIEPSLFLDFAPGSAAALAAALRRRVGLRA